MPPKLKKEPEEILVQFESVFTSHWRRGINKAEEAECICVDIMKDVTELACDLMVSNYMDRTVLPYTVQSISCDILNLIQFVFVGHDLGSTEQDSPSLWAADIEPKSLPPDNWARGMIPTRRAPVLQAAAVSLTNRNVGSIRKRPKSGEETNRPDTASTVRIASPQARTVGISAGSMGESVDLESIVQRASPRKDPNAGVSKYKPKSRAAAARPSVALSAGSGAFIGKDAHSLMLAEQEMRAKEQADREALEKTAKDLNNARREFTVDIIAGKVIPLRSIDVKLLPSKFLTPGVHVPSTDEAPVSLTSTKTGFVLQKKKKKLTSKTPAVAWLQPEEQAGPMVDEVIPVGGVTLRQGDISRRNEMRVLPGRPTRTEFKRTLDAIELTAEFSQAQEQMQSDLKNQMAIQKKKAREASSENVGAGSDHHHHQQQQQQQQQQPRHDIPLSQSPSSKYVPQAIAALPTRKPLMLNISSQGLRSKIFKRGMPSRLSPVQQQQQTVPTSSNAFQLPHKLLSSNSSQSPSAGL